MKKNHINTRLIALAPEMFRLCFELVKISSKSPHDKKTNLMIMAEEIVLKVVTA